MSKALVEKPDQAISKPPLSDKYVAVRDTLEEGVQGWLDKTLQSNDVPTLVGWAISLDVCKESVLNWAHRYEEGDHRYAPAFHALKKVKTACEQYLLQDTVQRKNAMSLALLKMNHGYMEEESRQKIDQAERGVASGTTIVINTGVPLPSAIPLELPTTNTYECTDDSTD